MMVKNNTRWPLLSFTPWRGVKSVLCQQNRNTVPILSLSLICFFHKLWQSCYFLQVLNRTEPHFIHWASEMLENPVPIQNEVKVFKTFANQELVKNSFWIKIIQQSNANSATTLKRKQFFKKIIISKGFIFGRCSEISLNYLQVTVTKILNTAVTSYL